MNGVNKRRITTLCLAILLISNPAWGEAQNYFGFFGGWSVGGKFSDFEIRDTEFNGLDASTSNAWGLKFGFAGVGGSGLSIEFSYFERHPEVKRQPVSATGTLASSLFPSFPFNGQIDMGRIAIRTFAVQLMHRFSDEWHDNEIISRFIPYFGFGVGLTIVRTGPVRVYDNSGNLVGRSDNNSNGSGYTFMGTLGLELKVTDSIRLFGEYILAPAVSLKIGKMDNLASTQTNYLDHLFVIGLTYRFGGAGSN